MQKLANCQANNCIKFTDGVQGPWILANLHKDVLYKFQGKQCNLQLSFLSVKMLTVSIFVFEIFALAFANPFPKER